MEDDLQKENARLRSTILKLHREIERARAERDELRALDNPDQLLVLENIKLKAELERLRALHEGAVNDWRNACDLMNKAEARARTLKAAHAECALREADLLKELAERKIPFPSGCSLSDDLRWQQDIQDEVALLKEGK